MEESGMIDNEMEYRDSDPEMPCSVCGHKRKEHNVRASRSIHEVKDCKLCDCQKFYPEKLTILES